MGADTALITAFSFLSWIPRIYYDGKAAWSDIRWITAFVLWVNRDLCKEIVFRAAGLIYRFTSLAYAAVVVLPSILALYLIISFYSRQISPSESKEPSRSEFLKPLIFPCRTTHSRLFPKKHSFSYSYLLVGIPIGWRGAIGSFLSADETVTQACISGRQRSWFSVNADDYLQRGHDSNGLRGKLQSFLHSQVSRAGWRLSTSYEADNQTRMRT